MNFSVTERQNAKRCPRMHRLSAKGGQHLGLIVPPVYLSVGTLIHQASQAWLLDTNQSYEAHVMVAASKLIEKAHARYIAQVGVKMSEEEEDPLWEALDFAKIMARNYELRWGTPLPDGFTLIRPEQRVVVPVPGTEHPCENTNADRDNQTGLHRLHYPDGTLDANAKLCPECDGSGQTYHYLDGRFDGLIQDESGRIHILEHKTYNSRPSEESLKNNDQFLAYMWLAIQLNVGDVAGLAYDGLWRRATIPRGRTFEDLFLRYGPITRSRAELREFERMLPNELNFMAAQLAAPTDPWINRRWQGCYDCSFATKQLKSGSYRPGLCDAISRNENVDAVMNLHYTVRDDDADEELEIEE